MTQCWGGEWRDIQSKVSLWGWHAVEEASSGHNGMNVGLMEDSVFLGHVVDILKSPSTYQFLCILVDKLAVSMINHSIKFRNNVHTLFSIMDGQDWVIESGKPPVKRASWFGLAGGCGKFRLARRGGACGTSGVAAGKKEESLSWA